MTFIYILLIIIAIGVLLASESGKKLLAILFSLAILGGILFLCFLAVVFVISFFNSDVGKYFTNIIFWAIGGIILLVMICFGVGKIIETLSQKEKRSEFWKKIKENFIKNKIKYIVFGALFGSLSIFFFFLYLFYKFL